MSVATTPSKDLTIDDLILQMLGEAPHRLEPGRAVDPSQAHALQVQHLNVPGSVEDFSLTAHAGRIYAIAGQVGSGASEVLRALGGLIPRANGTVELHNKPVPFRDPLRTADDGIAFVSNDRKSEGLFLDKSVAENLLATRLGAVAKLGVLQVGAERRKARSLAELSRLPESRLGHSVASLSGGNQQKVFVGRCLGRDDVHVLLLDEPTRGVDIGGRAAIHALLRQAADAGMVVVFASTELDELLDLGDVIITMREGRIVNRYDGGTDGAMLMRDMTGGEVAA